MGNMDAEPDMEPVMIYFHWRRNWKRHLLTVNLSRSETLRKMELPINVIRPLRGMYKSLRRRFKTGSSYGQPFRSTNGVMQGCPLSCLLLNAICSVAIRVLNNRTPTICVEQYVDDTSLLSKDRAATIQAMDEFTTYLYKAGQQLDVGKSSTLGVNGITPLDFSGGE